MRRRNLEVREVNLGCCPWFIVLAFDFVLEKFGCLGVVNKLNSGLDLCRYNEYLW